MIWFKRRKRSKRRRLYHLSPFCLQEANRTQAVRITGFLSQAEINCVRSVARNMQLPVYTNNPIDDVRDGQPVSTTKYLHTRLLFQQYLPWLEQRVHRLVCAVNNDQSWGLSTASPKFQLRVVEWHEMQKGGSLSSYGHYDIGSLITVDICLERALKGGQFQTVDATTEESTDVPFYEGDVIVFISHKRHRVTRLEEGHREVLVLEYWNGPKKTCGHRCDILQGDCDFRDSDDDDDDDNEKDDDDDDDDINEEVYESDENGGERIKV